MLLDRIRREGSTVASAVCAASVVAVRSLIPNRPRVHILTQINTCLRVNAIKRGTAGQFKKLPTRASDRLACADTMRVYVGGRRSDGGAGPDVCAPQLRTLP